MFGFDFKISSISGPSDLRVSISFLLFCINIFGFMFKSSFKSHSGYPNSINKLIFVAILLVSAISSFGQNSTSSSISVSSNPNLYNK